MKRDLPLYQITLCDGNPRDICLTKLQPGDVTKTENLLLTSRLW